MGLKQIEIIRTINGTNFHLHNFVGMTYERFQNNYFPIDQESGRRVNKYEVKWCPIKTWHEIQRQMIEVGLIEEYKGEHKK